MRDESEDEFSGMGGDPNAVVTPNSVKVTHRSVMLVFLCYDMMLFKQIRLILNLFSCRCSILSNATVKCDTGVYQSLQAWKDHKLHIDHEVTSFSRFCKSHTAVRVSVAALL